MCIQARIFPECLKQAIVVPIHKGGSLNIPSNFRPISLLPIIGKIFEKVIHGKIEDFLEKEKLINNNQFGFRRKRGTIDALLDFAEKIKYSWDRCKSRRHCLFLDLKKLLIQLTINTYLTNATQWELGD